MSFETGSSFASGYDIIDDLAECTEMCAIADPELDIPRACYAFSPEEDMAFNKIEILAVKICAGLVEGKDYKIDTDSVGNMFITLFGEDTTKSVMTGSHLDSVKNGGKYDGVAGVASGIELLQNIVSKGVKPQYNYTIAVWRGEESSPKTGVACLGSQLAVGLLSRDEMEALTYKTAQGESIPFSTYFMHRYGEEQWQKVLDLADNPFLSPDQIVCYEELHIEQSNVAEKNNVDVGIVVDGIGGAKRQEFSVSSDVIEFEKMETTDERPRRRAKICFTGERAHTGGTPHNSSLKITNNTEGETWYRKDALVAASRFARLAERILGDNILVEEFEPIEDTGFTTVPMEQTVDIAYDDNDATFKTIESILLFVERSQNVKSRMEVSNEGAEGLICYPNQDQLVSFVAIPLKAQELAIKVNNDTEGLGKVRLTVTDLHISPEIGVSFNVDYRDVDTEARSVLEAKFTTALEKLFTSLQLRNCLRDVLSGGQDVTVTTKQDKKFAPISRDLTDEKRKIAKDLGITHIEMPSLPGHDAHSLSKIGVPTTMTFVRHDGESHTPRERMSKEHFEKACALSHSFILRKLGIA